MLVALAAIVGCHRAKSSAPTAADVAAAQREADQEIAQARVEAKKDVRSAAKIMGANSKDVARAKVTGAFDIAMAHADGDHTVALTKCMTLEPAAQAPCKSQADVDYKVAADKAKALRVTQQ
jgi:hypothetical protein